MSREVQVYAWCDNPSVHGDTKVPALNDPTPIWLGKRVVYLDMCEECQLGMVKPLLVLAEEYGVPAPDLQPKSPIIRKGKQPLLVRDMPCMLCDQVYASGSGLTRHYNVVHLVPKEECTWRRLYGNTCPLCGQEDIMSVGSHTTRAHGGLETVQAFAEADRQGDPFGAVAARREHVRMLSQENQRVPRPPARKRAAKKTAARKASTTR